MSDQPELVTLQRSQLEVFVSAVNALAESAQEEWKIKEGHPPAGLPATGPNVIVDYRDLKRIAVLALGFIDRFKPYGTELFNALCRVTVTPAYEAVYLRLNASTCQIEVLLDQRAATETAHPGEWHCAGTCAQASTNEAGDFARLGAKEFGAPIGKRRPVDQVDAPDEPRGRHISLVFLCEVPEATKGTWFPVNRLPEPMVPIHRDKIIPLAVAAFEEDLDWQKTIQGLHEAGQSVDRILGHLLKFK